MRVVDANVLLYAVNSDAEHHATARRWLDAALGGADTVGLTWIALLAFVRLTTRVGLFPHPLPPRDAFAVVDSWIAAPGARVLDPGAGHVASMTRLIEYVGVGGNLVNDAHLAALALENRAEIVSYDNDFGRFPGLTWRRPDELLPGT